MLSVQINAKGRDQDFSFSKQYLVGGKPDNNVSTTSDQGQIPASLVAFAARACAMLEIDQLLDETALESVAGQAAAVAKEKILALAIEHSLVVNGISALVVVSNSTMASNSTSLDGDSSTSAEEDASAPMSPGGGGMYPQMDVSSSRVSVAAKISTLQPYLILLAAQLSML